MIEKGLEGLESDGGQEEKRMGEKEGLDDADV